MDLKEVLEYAKLVVQFLAIFGVVVEVAPIKISPLKAIGNRLMAGQNEKINNLSSGLEGLKKDFQIDKMERIRSELLEFSNSCMNKRKHTNKEFENIFKKEVEYKELCEKHEVENGYVEDNMKYVHRIYQKCLEEDSFLKYAEKE